MGLPQSPTTIITSSSSPHMYSQALQVKLYQAFIFSIPILFSIILFLLFYLFYLKRRSSSLPPPPPPPPILPRISSHASPNFISSPFEMDLKGELQEQLPKVVFDEDLRKKDSICCVCLGEFEMKEELGQVETCKHLFHIECINHWLQANTTCPLCRSSVLATPSHLPSKSSLITTTSQQQSTMLVVEASSSSSSSLSTTSSRIVSRVSNENEMDQPFALHIRIQNS